MSIFLYSFFIILLIVFIIYLLWKYESHLPSFFNILNKNKGNVPQSVNDWLVLLGNKKKINGIYYFHTDYKNHLISTGHKTFEKKELIDENTSFRLASVSKQFTAFAMMLLNKEKKIDYETQVSAILKEFPSKSVTIRHLLNHTSGVTADYIKLAKKYKPTKESVLSNTEATKLICKNTNEDIVPLELFYYNNSNYILLARIIELTSNLSFEEYMKANVFEKLNLKNTFVWNLFSKDKLLKKPNVANGFEAYLKSKPIYIKPSWLDGVAGDGAIFSSLNDLKKWLSFWEGNNFLNSDELNEAFKKPLLLDGSYSNYGFGWVIEDEFVWHNGKWLANNALVIKSIKDNKTLIVLDNSTNNRFEKISKILIQTIFKND